MLIEQDTAGLAWELSIKSLLKLSDNNFDMIPTEKKYKAIELQNVMMVVDSIFPNQLSNKYYNKEFLESFVNNFLHPQDDKKLFKRMYEYEYNGIYLNQLNEVVAKLKEAWYSRRCIVDIWQPISDIKTDGPPSINLIQFSIRNDKLNMTAYFRSNNAWVYALPDMIALINLQKQIASEINKPIGYYTHIANSYHIYECDISCAKAIFEAN